MIVFKPDVEKIKSARDHVAEIAADWPINEYFVRVVTSELVTNSVRHARTDEIRVDAYSNTDASVYTVEVWDADVRLPVLRSPQPGSPCGRGLLLVAKLATNWGADHDHGGKIVYAEWTRP
ncbi:hypothetical protein GCM10022254_58340 [Actinomadura meridiana]|uniref:Histidine kinase/HSP90-like ATPase domain-containing protein n=1 Tax=Actinomadura meridiana TaxID=559626 RepID=A0ABP8CH18_9ACTN